MTADILAAQVSTGEAVTFWILAPVALGSAIAMILSRSAVHAALLLVVDFFCLAAFYALQEAPFLAAVQVIVYTGAIMILFLFVLMLVGVDSSDSLMETLRGQRVAGLAVATGFALLLITAIGSAVAGAPAAGLSLLNDIPGGNPVAIARLLFSDYVFAFEITSALLITAALGAMVLAHRERVEGRPSQRELSRQRFAGKHPTPLPGPGVFATRDAVDTPALLPDGRVAPGSVSPLLADPMVYAGDVRISGAAGGPTESGRAAAAGTPPAAASPSRAEGEEPGRATPEVSGGSVIVANRPDEREGERES